MSDNVKLAVNRRKSTSIARTFQFRETVVIRATEREDQWGDSVLARVCNTIDLVAVEAKYHKECRIKFFLKTNEQHEAEYSRGRPESEYRSKAFNYTEQCFIRGAKGVLLSPPDVYLAHV